MQKENYVSEELENVFINDFINSGYVSDNFWKGRVVMLYALCIRIFKYQMETNTEINFNNSLEFFLENYEILKTKNLLSVSEIESFNKMIESFPALYVILGKIKYNEKTSENYNYLSMSIEVYLKENNFLIDFFRIKNDIENF